MDIGTAKPQAELRERLPHHLIDILDPSEQYTAGDFVRLADETCLSLTQNGILPIISGGTGFYVRSFICGASSAPKADEAIRRSVQADLSTLGSTALRAELEAADPASAIRIKHNDIYRLTRAVEILRATGQAPSLHAPSGLPRGLYDFLVLGIKRSREELKERIERRVAAMIEEGLEAEVKKLVARGYGPDSPGMKAIGYSEFLSASNHSPAEIAKAIVLHTQQYAKRQMTFLRRLPGIVWIDPEPADLEKEIALFLNQ
jgi:tRNA dimethylallyltransferase